MSGVNLEMVEDQTSNQNQEPRPARLPPIGHMSDPGTGDMNNKVGVDNNGYEPENGNITMLSMKKLPEENGSDPTIVMPNDADSEGEHEEKKKPIAFCVFIAKRTNLAFGITLGAHCVFILMTLIMMLAGYDIFPLDFEAIPMNLDTDDTYLRAMAWQYRNEDDGLIVSNTSAAFVGERSETADIIQIFYQASNVLTKEKLEAIEDMEAKGQTNVAGWTKFCKLTNGTCEKPLSLIRFFDGTYDGIPYNANDRYADIPGTLFAVSGNPVLKNYLDGLIGKSAVITSTTATSTLTRSLFYLGQPLIGYDLTTDSKEDQAELIQDFIVDEVYDQLEDANKNGRAGMSINYYSINLFSYEITKNVQGDLMLAVCSMVFIYFFMVFQTRSLFITSFAMLSILSSFVIANSIYRVVLDYRYFGTFHVLSIFIILGIGADNIFVFYDCWRATALEGHPTLEDRLSETYRRAPSSMSITSLTTFVAFIANFLSPLLIIKTFGLFSAVLIAVNFCSAIIFFPCVVIFYHKHFENWQWPCFKPLGKCFNSMGKKCCPKCCSDDENDGKDDEEKPNIVVRFFDGPYWRAITHKFGRWVFIVICTASIVVFVWQATTMEVSAESVQVFKNGHNLQDAIDLNNNAFKVALDEREIKVLISFGLKNQDIDDCHKTDTECKGKTVWDESFDLDPKPAQVELLKFCDYIRNLQGHPELRLLRDPVNNTVDVKCFIKALDDHMQTSAGFALPTSETKLSTFFDTYAAAGADKLYNETLVKGPNFYRYFETVLEFWLNNEYPANKEPLSDYGKYGPMVGQTSDSFDTANIEKDGFTDYKYGTRLRYAAIEIPLTLQNGQLNFYDGMDVYDDWEDFVSTEVAKLPPSLQGGVQFVAAGQANAWHNFKVQRTLAESASSGMLTGLCLAFVVMTFATMNIVLSSLATLVLLSVTITVAGFIPVLGWKFSVLESINLSLVVGLAVDYVVHLSESYHAAHATNDRKLMVRHMLRDMGISVVSGAMTTMGASAFMMAAQIQFFVQFGVFIFITIAFSMIYSLCLFTALLGLFGPVGKFGSLKPLVKWLKYKLQGRKKTDISCGHCEAKGFHDKDKYKVE